MPHITSLIYLRCVTNMPNVPGGWFVNVDISISLSTRHDRHILARKHCPGSILNNLRRCARLDIKNCASRVLYFPEMFRAVVYLTGNSLSCSPSQAASRKFYVSPKNQRNVWWSKYMFTLVKIKSNLCILQLTLCSV